MVFLIGSELFGESAGLLALLLVVFEPNVLANSDLVTTDVGVTCFFLATIYCFYRYARQPSLIRLLLTGLAAGLTLASKHSGILLVPMLLALVVAIALQIAEAVMLGLLLEEPPCFFGTQYQDPRLRRLRRPAQIAEREGEIALRVGEVRLQTHRVAEADRRFGRSA